jgi:hypothetical protein
MGADLGRRTLLGSTLMALAGACFFILVGIVAAFFIYQVRTGFGDPPGVVFELTDEPIGTALLILFVILPGGFLMGWREIARGLTPRWRGALAGWAYAFWALSCAVVVPYLGIYPIVWSTLFIVSVFGWTNQGIAFWLSLYALHLTLCPLVGACLFSFFDRWKQSLRSSQPREES